ncbi:MAG: BrnT family toxin [Gammaproteobacteria bacterium]|nr:BrnT family toxin [Gammaproteobacteria bacterium]
MSDPTFEWDRNKASENVRKHGVTFEEARSAFLDENARVIPDPEHSDDEDRFVLLGLSVRLRLLVVVHVWRDNVIRIISVRRADRLERQQYSEFLL